MEMIGLLAVLAGALILATVTFWLIRSLGERREEERQRLRREAHDQREQAAIHDARARELGSVAMAERRQAERHSALADEHAEKAAEHAEKAAELEEVIRRAGRYAEFHEGRAADHQERLA
jgi:hypothetical protein